jgi:predicted transcriptional regulator with HTH domain
MSIFTDRELEFLASLRTCWRRLYLTEIARLLREDDSNARQTKQRSLH